MTLHTFTVRCRRFAARILRNAPVFSAGDLYRYRGVLYVVETVVDTGLWGVVRADYTGTPIHHDPVVADLRALESPGNPGGAGDYLIVTMSGAVYTVQHYNPAVPYGSTAELTAAGEEE